MDTCEPDERLSPWLMEIAIKGMNMTGSSDWAIPHRCVAFSLLSTLFLLSFNVLAAGQDTRALWVASGKSAFKIPPLGDSPLLELSGNDRIRALSVDQKNNQIWVYGHKHLWKYDSQGDLLLSLDVPDSFGDHDPVGMIVDGNAGNLWIGIHKKMYRLDLDGNFKTILEFNHSIAGFCLDSTRSHLWISISDELTVLDNSGDTIFTISLDHNSKPVAISCDMYLNQIWAVSKNNLARYDETGTQVFYMHRNDNSKLDDFIAADGQGGLWLAGKKGMEHFDQNGLNELHLEPFGKLSDEGDVHKVTDLVADTRSHTIWVANQRYIKEYDNDGNFLKIIDSSSWFGDAKQPHDDDDHGHAHIHDMAIYSGTSAPQISITEPHNRSYTNYSQPKISLEYIELGSGIDPTTIAIKSGGIPLQVTCQASPTGAQCIPTEALSDGQYSFSVSVGDIAGHISEPVVVTFTVDTVSPPLPIGNLLGFELDTSYSLILNGQAGSVSLDTAKLTITNVRTGQTVTGSINSDGSFSIMVPGSGSDVFVITLADLAGNITAPFYMHGSDVPLQLVITSPTSGTTVSGDIINVTGTFQGPVNSGISVNGTPAVLSGGEWVVNNVSLNAGSNILSATATTSGGLTVTKTVNVVSTRTSSLILNAAHSSAGVAPLTIEFQYQFFGESTPQSIKIDYTGNGNYTNISDPEATLNYTYPSPGIYSVTLALADSNDAQYQASVLVVVYDADQMDRLFKNIWSDMTIALVGGNKTAAMVVLDETAQRNYEQAFDVLIPHMKDIVNTFSPLLRSSISDSIGEYAVVRSSNEKNNLFFVYFLKNQAGIWRLDAM